MKEAIINTEKFTGENKLNKKMKIILKENGLTITDVMVWLESKGYSVEKDEDTVS